MSTTERSPAARIRRSSRLAATLVLVGAAIMFSHQFGGQLPQFAAYVDRLGFWGPTAFILGYILTTIALVPSAVMTLAAGAIFGLMDATVYVLTGATLGSAAAFLIARHLARDAVAARITASAKFSAIDRAIGMQGFKIVLLLRLSPIFPYNLLNYSLGLTTVRFVDYILASVGMLPGTVLYAYSGVLVGDLARMASGAVINRSPLSYGVLILGFIATVMVTVLIARIARTDLHEATEPATEKVATTSRPE